MALAQFKLHPNLLRLRFVNLSFRLNWSNAPLLAQRVRGRILLLTPMLHLYSAWAWSKSMRNYLLSKEKSSRRSSAK